MWARKKKRLSSLPKDDVILNTEPNLSYGVVESDFAYQDNVVYGITEACERVYEVIDPSSS